MAAPASRDDSPDLTACTAHARDGCAVDTEPLAVLVRGYTDRWERQHETPATVDRLGRRNGGARSKRDDRGAFVAREPGEIASAVEALADRTRQLDRVRGQGVPPRTIYRILGCASAVTELRIADQLVQAIGETLAFYDERLVVKPNPKASREARSACCGGSLTGSGS